MPIEKQTSLYEILIRMDGNTFVGAHSIDLEKIVDTDTGEVLGVKELMAMPIEEAHLAGVLSSATAQALEALQALQNVADEKTSVEAALAKMTEERDALIEQRGTINAEINALKSENAELKKKVPVTVDEQGFVILSPVQIRLGLLAGGITSDKVEEMIDAIPDANASTSAKYYWQYSREYHRNNPLIAQLGGMLGLSSEDIDALWKQAEQL